MCSFNPTNFRDGRILVVGGAGFVGSNLVRHLLEGTDCRVDIVDNLLSSERDNVPNDARVVFRTGSIAHDEILKTIRDDYDYIFHLATYHGNQNSIHDPLADHENNTLTTLKLYDRIRSFKRLKKVVYAGAGCAVAEKTYAKAHATPEDAPISLDMDSPYSISKIIGEFYSVYYHRQHGLPTIRARFQNVYGPGEMLGAGRWRGTPATVWRNVTPAFVYKALKGLPLPVDNHGIATRDFIFVEDICRGLMACALKGTPGEVYNLATSVETSILQLATLINELTGNLAGVEYRPPRPWDHSGKRFGSTEKARLALGFEACVPLRDGMTRTIDWTRAALPQIDACIAKHAPHMVGN